MFVSENDSTHRLFVMAEGKWDDAPFYLVAGLVYPTEYFEGSMVQGVHINAILDWIEGIIGPKVRPPRVQSNCVTQLWQFDSFTSCSFCNKTSQVGVIWPVIFILWHLFLS